MAVAGGVLGRPAPFMVAPFVWIRAQLVAEVDRRRLFLWLPACLALGVVLYTVADGTPSPWPGLAATLASAALAWRARGRLLLFPVLIAISAVAGGFTAMAFRVEAKAAPVLPYPISTRFEGHVVSVDHGPSGGRILLETTGFDRLTAEEKPRFLRLSLTERTTIAAGDHVALAARLMPPPQPAYPGGYDFARDAWFKQIGAVGRVSGAIRLAPATTVSSWELRLLAAIDRLRNQLTDRIVTVIGGQAGALSAALVTGKRGLISEEENERLRASGLYHIVSISGLHMVLAAGVFFWVARAGLALVPGLSDRRPVKKLAALVAMAGATAYCLFSGSEVATERSLIMVLTMLGAILVDRPALSMRNLAISAIVVILREPETLLGPSFQMSFAAVAGLIAGHEVWSKRRRKQEAPSAWGGRVVTVAVLAIGGSLATTLIASLATAPFAAFHFHRGNPYGLIGNALAIPFVSLIVMPAAVAGTVLAPFGLDAWVWQLMGAGSAMVLWVAARVAAIDGAVSTMRAFDVGWLLLFTAGFVWLTLISTVLRLAGLLPVAVAIAMMGQGAPATVIIDRQGTLAAVRGEDNRLTIAGHPRAAFTVERWLQADGDSRRASDSTVRAAARCDPLACVARLPDGGHVSVVRRPEAFEEDCKRARIIVTPLTAPPACRTMALVFDRESLRSTQSLALFRQGDDLRIVAARSERGSKPWFGTAPRPAALSAGQRGALPVAGPAEPPVPAEPIDDDPLPLEP
jgi:competence protein ComEC